MTNKKLSSTDIITTKHYMKLNNIEVYNKKSVLRSILGGFCIVVGITTFFIPFTTIPLCLIGGVLIGYDMKSLIKKIGYEKRLKILLIKKRFGLW